MSEVAKWYSNKSIFVTGATGFVGKCLVEKLLRSCPDIVTIYIIIRSKHNVSFEQRKSDYKNHLVFSTLKNTNPHALDKLIIVPGDVCQQNLGMSIADRKLIAETVSIVFHVAADVRFSRSLIDAYNTNVHGSKLILDFASEFEHLQAFVLVSTAFSQTIEVGKLEERHYETSIRPEILQKFVEKLDADALDALTPKILGNHPNTYSFTKGIIEQLVHDYKDKFPTAVARPPIIIHAWKEPLPGYTEGKHGVNGWALATSRGVLRSVLGKPDAPCNVLPADIVSNGIIILAYECGKRSEKRFNKPITNNEDDNAMHLSENYDEPLYFNITDAHPLIWQTYIDLVTTSYNMYPFDFALWFPRPSITEYRFYNFICVMLFQVLPATFIDMLLVLSRKRPFMLKIQRMISDGSHALEHFLNNVFLFESFNYNTACKNLNEIDRKIFYDQSTISIDEYCKIATYGSKIYLAKEKPENIPKARATHRRLWFVDIITKLMLSYWILKRVLSYFDSIIY